MLRESARQSELTGLNRGMDMRRGRKVATTIATIVAGLICLSLVPVYANDSAAAMAAGGLDLIKNDQVRMVSEVLRIAPRLVDVDYVFENTGASDVTTLVAFPLPELDAVSQVPVNIPFPGTANLVGFQVWIDGHEIKPDIEVRAFSRAGEITAELRRLAVDPIVPKILDPKRPELKKALLGMQLLYDDDIPAWTVKVSFHWQQTFPAGKQVTIKHRYRPIYGLHYIPVDDSIRDFDALKGSIKRSDLGGQWCYDQSFNVAELTLLDRQRKIWINNKALGSKAHSSAISYENVQYVLKTGANWHGPIGRFELQIDKAAADLVSTCPIPGLRLQPAPYGFNAVASDYTPTSDLDIIFVSGSSLGLPSGSSP